MVRIAPSAREDRTGDRRAAGSRAVCTVVAMSRISPGGQPSSIVIRIFRQPVALQAAGAAELGPVGSNHGSFRAAQPPNTTSQDSPCRSTQHNGHAVLVGQPAQLVIEPRGQFGRRSRQRPMRAASSAAALGGGSAVTAGLRAVLYATVKPVTEQLRPGDRPSAGG